VKRGALARRLRLVLLAATAVLATLVAVLFATGAVGERAELASVDARFAIRGKQPAPKDLMIVGIDDVTFDELPEGQDRFPFDRRIFAKVLANVSKGGPKAIVYDVQFTEAQGPTDDDAEADNALIEASAAAGNVIFSTTEVGDSGATNVFGGPEGQEFAKATVGNGLLPEGPGGVLRRIRYSVDGLPALSVRTLQRIGRPVDRKAMAGDGAWIDFSGGPRHVETVSFSRVWAGKVPPATFRDRIVVIGGTAPSLQDRHQTSWSDEAMPGPEIHANAISTLLRGVPLRSSAGWVDILLAVLMSLLAPLAGLRLRALIALGLSVAAALAFAVATQVAFDQGHIVAFVGPMLGLVIGTAGAMLVHLLTTTVEKAQMRDLFARFVPDSVVDQVLAKTDSGDLRLGGIRLVSTVMFSDLRGFTSFSEQRTPEEVIDVLNRYLTLMSNAILDHGGTLVAYMGDGIMAVFGAPIDSNDHADRALAAARDMVGEMDGFNAWMAENGYGEGFKMGIGLNTGEVMSGNVGSDRRLEYTAIGDTTNTAARLEGMTKGTPYQLFISGSTYEALSVKPEGLQFVDDFDVRGRERKLPVWGLTPSRDTVQDSA
jgi:adenylate cyclase